MADVIELDPLTSLTNLRGQIDAFRGQTVKLLQAGLGNVTQLLLLEKSIDGLNSAESNPILSHHHVLTDKPAFPQGRWPSVYAAGRQRN